MKDPFDRDTLLGHLTNGKVSTVLYLAIIAAVIWALIKFAPYAFGFLKCMDVFLKELK